MNWKQQLGRNISNIPGWRTNRKIVVIESDDWGSIRMPSRNVLDVLQKEGLDVLSGDSARYNLYDTLESKDDLDALFYTLKQCRDRWGNYPVFTPICVVANPDFERIKKDDFANYYWEPFSKTAERYRREHLLIKYQEGIVNRLFVPQFHGREHLNVAAWMTALQKNDRETRLAFESGMWGFNNRHPHGVMFQAAFDLEKKTDLVQQHSIIESGLQLFEQLFGYKATYFVPPNGPFNNELEQTAAENGIRYMFAPKKQTEVLGEGKTRTVYHWLAQKNKWGQRYIMRNVFFEPNQHNKNLVEECLQSIAIAFAWNKPAVISSHRTNYIGGLVEANRDQSQVLLKELLLKILDRWPQTEFMGSGQLGDLINESLS